MTGRKLLLLAAAAVNAVPGWGQLPYRIFSDVPSSAPYYNQVNLLRERLITTGCSASPQLYCPTYNVDGLTPYYLTRGQAAVFIIRSLFSGLSGNPEGFTAPGSPYFADVPSTHGQFAYIQKLKELGITSGCTETNFCPDQGVSHGELSVFIYRARQKKLADWEYASVSAPPECSNYPFSDVPPTHIFCPYIANIANTVGPNAVSPECPYSSFCPDVLFNENTWIAGVRVRRGTIAFYLVKGVLNANNPESLPTSAGQLDPVSIPGAPADCDYSGIGFLNTIVPVGPQLYGLSYTNVHCCPKQARKK